MRQILAISLFFLLPMIGNSQDVPEKQMSLITKITATWCSNCGSYGWTFFKDAITDNEGDAIFAASHPSGALLTPEGQDLQSNFSASGQPRFYLGNMDLLVNNSNTATKRTELANAVDQLAASSPIVGAGIEVTKDGNTLTAKTKTKFFADAAGKYNLSVLVIEDHVSEAQASQNSPADHRYVLRGSFEGSTFGENIIDNGATIGQEIEKTYTLEAESSWNLDNTYFVAVVWEDVNGKYQFVNGNQVELSTTSGAKDLFDERVLQVSWEAMGDGHQLNISNERLIEDLNIELIGINGQVINRQTLGDLSKGYHPIALATENLPAASYAVRIFNNDFQKTVLIVK